MTFIEFGVSMSKVKVTVISKLRGGGINVSQTFLVLLYVRIRVSALSITE